jgi:hypothetical protein
VSRAAVNRASGAQVARPRRLLRFYARLNRIDDWFERRFTVAGRVVLWSAVGAALFSLDTRRSLAYQMFALALALLVMALLWTAARKRAPVTVRRHLPDLVTAGQPFSYRLDLRSEVSGGGHECIWVHERLYGALPDEQAFASLREPSANRRSWFDRKLGFPRWIWLTRRSRGGRCEGVDVTLDLTGSASQRLEMTPLRRGYIEFEALDIGRTEPSGLCRRVETRALCGRVLALPHRFLVAPMVLPGRGEQFSAGAGLTLASGQSTEFLGVREFKPGDAVKHIHWKRFASLGEPIVREFQAQATRRLAVALDTAGGLAGEPVFEAAVSVAASVLEVAASTHGVVDLLLPGEVMLASAKGGSDPETMLAALATVAGGDGATLGVFANEILAQRSAVAGVLCVVLGFDEMRREFVERLSAAGMEVSVIVLLPDGVVLPAATPGMRFVNASQASAQLLT